VPRTARSIRRCAKLPRVEISSDVLRAAAADPAAPVWKVVWEQSCHHGTCDPASAALLPWLTTTIRAFGPGFCLHAPHLNDGEVDVQCPECDEEILLDLLAGECEITPGLSSELAERLHAEAVAAGREAVAEGLTHLFGQVRCTECGASFNIAQNLAGV
jgi:hypothetical protein